MDKFVPKAKLSKKEKKKLAAGKRTTWTFSPVTKRIDSKKTYNRKKISRAAWDDSTGDSFFCVFCRATGPTPARLLICYA